MGFVRKDELYMSLTGNRHFQKCHMCHKLFYISCKKTYINKGWDKHTPIWFCSKQCKEKYEEIKNEKGKNTN